MTKHLWSAYLAGMAVTALVHSSQSDPAVLARVWQVVAWSAVVATVAGLHLHRPARPGPWWLTAGGLAATAMAAVVAPPSVELPDASTRAIAGDVLHMAAYLMIGAAVLWFVRLQNPDGDRDSVVDGIIVAVALATVLWTVVIDPAALGADASLSGRAVYIVAPLLPAGITAVCIRLLFSAGWRVASARLLGGAWILAFLGSVGWILLLQADAMAPGGWADLLWIAALGCAGASALHPSMVDMSRPAEGVHRTVSAGRLTVMGSALLATPVALLLGAGTADVNVVAPVAGAGLIALIILGRLAGLVQDREQAGRQLEAQAARQEVVARVGEAALGDRPIGLLYAEAAALATEVLDGVEVTLRADASGPPLGDRTTPVSLPVTDGERVRASLEATAGPRRVMCPDERAFLTSVAAVLSAMTARRQAEDDLRRRALHDELTGLPNRVLLHDRLHDAVARRERGPVGVLFVDLDGFKPVNDEHGHDAGDSLLAALAARMRSAVREGDTVGRLAGDEFVVVAPECAETELLALAEGLVATLSEPVPIGDDLVLVGASVGATVASPGDGDAREALRRADAAMYAAKEAGGGMVAVRPAPAASAPAAPRAPAR